MIKTSKPYLPLVETENIISTICPRDPFGEISLNYLTKHDFPERLPSKTEIKTNIDGKSVRGKITRTPNQKHKQTSKLQVRKSYGPKI